MSAGWQVGDLALCVNVARVRVGRVIGSAGERLSLGCVYRVAQVYPCSNAGTPGTHLELDEQRGRTAIATRFRKIHADEREACEPEFVTLLNRIKRKIGEPA